MNLREYFETTNIPLNVFADRCKLTTMQIYRLINQKCVPSLRTALTIEFLTGGLVTAWDLLPEKHQQEIRKEQEKEV